MSKGLFLGVSLLVGALAGAAIHLAGRPGAGPAAEDAGAGRVAAHAVGDRLPLEGASPDVARVPDAADAPAEDPAPAGAAGSDARSPARTPPAVPTYSYYEGVMRVAPSVVSLYASVDEAPRGTPIATDGHVPSPADEAVPTRRSISQGSGVVVDPNGIVLTNLHLVEEADTINVVLADGTLHTGRLVGSDRETDLAVVRVAATGLAAVALDDAPPLRVGDVVLAIGNPFGVGQTVTQGIVSATRRRVAGASAWQDFVQIDAAINPGNSGGALINPAGQLVGVTTAVFRGGAPSAGGPEPEAAPGDARYAAQGIGFAIPAELLARVVPQIIAEGRVVRGWLGIGADDLPMFPELHRRYGRGAVITAVLPDGPAADAGLARLDVVTRVDGRVIADATDLLLLVSSLAPGTEIGLVVGRRDAGPRELRVRLGERPPLEEGSPH